MKGMRRERDEGDDKMTPETKDLPTGMVAPPDASAQVRGGGPALMYAAHALEALEQFEAGAA